jgi:HK97 family phage prohead protease
MNRAWAQLEIKATSDTSGKRTFSGIATTPSTDRMDDQVMPEGAKFKLPIPFLWQHDSRDPIGWITAARVTPKGIEVDGEVADFPEPGPLKDRLTMAWQMLKSKLVRGLSIGFNSIKSARIDGTYGLQFLEWEWLELSAVTIAANQEASITTIKSIDSRTLAALGTQRSAVGNLTPGASGNSAASRGNSTNRSQKGHDMKTLKELRDERTTKLARQAELVAARKSADGQEREFDADERAEFSDLAGEITSLDDQIMMGEFHLRSASGAREVRGGNSEEGSRSRDNSRVIVKSKDKDDKFAGQSFVRLLIARTLAKQTDQSPIAIAQKRWGETNPTIVALLKAAVAGGGTGSGEWGSELAQSDTKFTGDFLTFLYAQTVFDRLPLRQVPARVHIKGQDGQGTGYWVGESKPIPATALDFSDVELLPNKVAALAVVSNEWLADSDPGSEQLVRDALVQASAQRVDTTFLSAVAASAGVSPAGILNGLTPIGSAGTDAAALRTDIKALYRPFITAKNASNLTLVMNPSTAKALSLLVNALGQTEFPGLNATGGTLLGDTVVTGDNVDPSDIILIKPSDVWRIGDTGVEITMSKEAMIEQDSAPTGATDTPTAATATFTSMFQEESTAFKVVRRIAFQKRRTSAVSWINNADYDGVTS